MMSYSSFPYRYFASLDAVDRAPDGAAHLRRAQVEERGPLPVHLDPQLGSRVARSLSSPSSLRATGRLRAAGRLVRESSSTRSVLAGELDVDGRPERGPSWGLSTVIVGSGHLAAHRVPASLAASRRSLARGSWKSMKFTAIVPSCPTRRPGSRRSDRPVRTDSKSPVTGSATARASTRCTTSIGDLGARARRRLDLHVDRLGRACPPGSTRSRR